MIDIERLLRIPFVDCDYGFDLSPHGTRLAFAWNVTGEWEIYELDLNAPDAPRPVSAGPGGKFNPRYSPDGSHLAYAVDFDGGENFHIFVQACHAEPRLLGRSISGSAVEILRSSNALPQGDPLDLTPDIDFAIQPRFCWSPDGTQIAFLSNQSGCFSAYAMPAGGGEARLLFDNGFPAWDVAWSPDGSYLAVMCQGTGQELQTYIVPLDGSEPFPIGNENGLLSVHNPAWSPDSGKLAFNSDFHTGFHQIGFFDINSRRVSWLTDGEANCRLPSWSKDGTQLVYLQSQGASDKVSHHPFHDGKPRSLQVETGVYYQPHFTPDGKHLVFVFNNPRHPPDIWMLALESGEFRQVTHSMNNDDFAQRPAKSPGTGKRGSRAKPAEAIKSELMMPVEITYPGLDGTPVPALLFKSKHADQTTPAVIVIHGGPGWHYQVEWHPFMTHLASRGWTVLAPNYRGSTGYGREWQLANRYNLGGVDTDDVAAGVRYFLDTRIADPKRIAVTGRSHGGYLTMSCLTRYPDLWRAGSAVVPFLNWFTGHANSREDLRHWDLENFGNPVDHRDLWYERSPFFFLDRVNAPVQLICAENDPRCPASESLQAHDRLLEFGKEVDFHLYLGEGHAFLKTENVVDAEVRRVNFLARSLQ